MAVQSSPPAWEGGEFRHEALLYSGDDEFVAGALPFIEDAVRSDEPILVVVDQKKIDLLRERVGSAAGSVLFADMDAVGSNPARIIPAWQDFVKVNAVGGKRVRGIGEPISSRRGPDELIECQHHEALLNMAFADTPDFWLLCPYDMTSLGPEVIDEAHRSHPFVSQGMVPALSPSYRGLDGAAAHFEAPLPAPPETAERVAFAAGSVRELRERVAMKAAEAGLDDERTGDFVLTASELVTNSIRHGGGAGMLLVWATPEAVVCEVRDQGRFPHPLVDRQRPSASSDGGRGLWLVNQLCDLVQVRSVPEGTVVRAHLRVA